MSGNQITRHHIIPRSRGGRTIEDNIAHVPNREHEAYHALFSNRTPDEILRYLVDDFWNGDDKYIREYEKRQR
jgi:hypothetical protein